MKTYTYSLILSLLVLFNSSFAQQKLKANLTYTTFNNVDSKPYVETHLLVRSNTVKYELGDNGKYQASINVQYIFKRDGEIINFDKFNLKSPEIDNISSNKFNFMNQQRYALDNGKYEFFIEISDANNPDEQPFKVDVPLEINYTKAKISVSGIELVESIEKTEEKNTWNKSGLKIIPYTTSYYPPSINRLSFYTEIYNTDKIFGEGDNFLVKYYIKDEDKNTIISNLSKFEKMKATKVIPLIRQFDISSLASGNYSIIVEVRDKKNALLGFNAMQIIRNNPSESKEFVLTNNNFTRQYTNVDTLTDMLKALRPISSENESSMIGFLTKQNKIERMQDFLYEFWYSRYQLDAEAKFIEYQSRIDFTIKKFSTQMERGYDTDRGYVYLKYGVPNSRNENINNSYAYINEIWQYYKLDDGQSNIKFVFFADDASNNDFFLVHSTARGEINNDGWMSTVNNRIRTLSHKEWDKIDNNHYKNEIKTSEAWGSNVDKEW